MKCRSLMNILCALLLSLQAYCQSNRGYSDLTNDAYDLYKSKKFELAAKQFSMAFARYPKSVTIPDVYNSACSWVLASKMDSSLILLKLLVNKLKYSNLKEISTDKDFNVLHDNPQWIEVLRTVRANERKALAKLNRPLIRLLDTIYSNDQGYRRRIDTIELKYGSHSSERADLFKRMAYSDSINLARVKKAISKTGWLGDDIVGEKGNETVWLVIQHADLKTQLRYLPFLRKSVKSRHSKSYHLALMEDRTLVYQGKKQIYGSQFKQDPTTGKYQICPIQDEHYVNERRKSVGLPPLEDDAKTYGIIYKLPE